MLWTIGGLLDKGYSVHAHCLSNGCGYNTDLPLEALAERHGRDAQLNPPNRIGRRRLRCSHCGSNQVTVRLTPPYTPGGYR